MRLGSSNLISKIDEIIKQSLSKFIEDIRTNSWLGREREAISLYVFAHLLKFCNDGSFLYDPAQICIESPVPQLVGADKKHKRQVCKDLVIWQRPMMTCWDEQRKPTKYPIVIMEWKTIGFGGANNNKLFKVSANDVKWLERFSAGLSNFIGYATCLDIGKEKYRLSCTRIFKGASQEKWFETF